MARQIVRVRGVVQGVGFRPFVHRAAERLALHGAVWNEPDGVVIDVEGDPRAIAALIEEIERAPPPRAAVQGVVVEQAAPTGARGFSIAASRHAAQGACNVSVDLAPCAACLAEQADPADRRYGHAFINCTDCGPRFSIARDVPYDRQRTTMSGFAMCPACAEEYADPRSRRYHAQPNACPRCGPTLAVVASAGAAATDAAGQSPLVAAVRALGRGQTVAVKGAGGFHLACDAQSQEAVLRLRARKRRGDKPLAVMFADLASVEQHAIVGGAAAALGSVRRPIVLLARRAGSTLAPALAPGLGELGAMLPSTPLHHLLLSQAGGPLVMTSGNLSDEPIIAANDEALARLGGLADLFLLHDRDVHAAVDDSIERELLGKTRVLRRGRGHVPEAIDLGFQGPDVLAVGADLKAALCLTSGSSAFLSQHLGDLESYEALSAWSAARDGLERLLRVRPRCVAHDLHPGYHATALARRTGLPLVAVQHHHAHVASCLVDNARRERVLGVAWDGTGYGTDGSVWGGEILAADLHGFERLGRIRPVGMVGADAAVRQPWRMALSWLLDAGLPAPLDGSPERAGVLALLRRGAHTTTTSSAGRLFDAIASLARVRDVVSYEGQAAVELEALTLEGEHEPYPLPAAMVGGLIELDPRPLVHAVVRDVEQGAGAGLISARFHAALADALGRACELLRGRTGLGVVALTGGCFQSRRLTLATHAQLTGRGFEVLLHSRVPPNDGGIALGQAAVAAWRHRDVPGDPR